MGFELTTAVFERVKTVHALYLVPTVIGREEATDTINISYSTELNTVRPTRG
jgi:hypothetical protein